MSLCVVADVNGYFVATADTYLTCAGYILISPTDYVMATEVFLITPADVLTVFSWGFGAVCLFGLGIPYAVKIARELIKQL